MEMKKFMISRISISHSQQALCTLFNTLYSVPYYFGFENAGCIMPEGLLHPSVTPFTGERPMMWTIGHRSLFNDLFMMNANISETTILSKTLSWSFIFIKSPNCLCHSCACIILDSIFFRVHVKKN